MPNAFSKMLGNNTHQVERLISRGACISWSPKNLASALIMFGIKWMVSNTEFRLFTAYSDWEAGEIGQIYQACNFYYLGKKFGAKKRYLLENGNWTSDRYFRSRSAYKRAANRCNIEWNPIWQERDKVRFDLMPPEIAHEIKQEAKRYMLSRPVEDVMPKGKYAYVLGKDKRETKYLRRLFESNVKTYEYPKRK